MKKKDLHDIFIEELYKKGLKRVDLINQISDILKLEKESIYRRMAGKVNFSVREMGILAKAMNISLDSLLYNETNCEWLPFMFESPLTLSSMDSLFDMMDSYLIQIKDINREDSSETGNVYNALPLEFFIYSPLITKFMFFKWGSYFIQSEEFDNFSDWKLPYKLSKLAETYDELYKFQKAFYIWDSSLIWSIAREIKNFHKMRIISTQDKNDIKEELKEILSKIEKTLNGTYVPRFTLPSEAAFYVSTINMGFTSCYFTSGEKHLALFQTNFCFSFIKNSEISFKKIKEWIKSFCQISTLLSGSGRIERRLFFDKQYEIIDEVLR